MEPIKVDINGLAEAALTIKNYQMDRQPQRLEAILPIALQLIKSKMYDLEEKANKRKFFAPAWVGILMGKLNNGERLSDIDYATFQQFVAHLKPEDYKLCADNILGYEVRYLSTNEIMETVNALKKYFNVR